MTIKTALLIISVIAICTFAVGNVSAQGKKTIVLVRHVEKDASPTADKGDPELSPEGRERAVRLAKAIRKYKPTEIFSTNYKRTRQSVEPIANLRKKQIQTYDPAKPAELVEKIMASKTIHN